MWTDTLGNPVTLDGGGASLALLNDFVEGFIASEARAANVLQAQHDPSPIVQAAIAAVHLFAESATAAASARPHVLRAQAGAHAATPRERQFIAAVAAWADGDIPSAVALHEAQAREHPRDLASLKLGHYHLFNRGDSPGMLRMALAALPAAADVPYLHGMLAFAWEQCHALDEAETQARTAIAMRRKEPWAHHALAHVLLTQGRLHEGHDFLADVSETWTGLNSFMVTHNWWHQALFALDLDRADEVLALYDQQVWGVACDYTQDQVNAVSLLARLELAGVDVGSRWDDVAGYLARRTADQVLPFLDLQYLVGLGRAGRPEADTLLANIAARARAAGPTDAAWAEVAWPAARGLLAWTRGDHAACVRDLGQALPRLLEIGGSHAQRDLFAQIHLDALVRSGHLGGAQNLLQPQLRAQPESRRLRRQAAALYAALGLGGATEHFL
ncbi:MULTISPECIES: tetratricopeptide repeat protein [Ramlibacter]|uniref:Tetratricopeptide repeat protein 38 n=1 Tax=Ramlibacter pinisoli TaxID=2682844 RepID=A0A6N8IV72_9BURK|nr:MULTISPECIES: tetratricopeptide repeat protein [Ramlibacter]MBA2965065.1 tetratricopeptide repeat protein [Ramlibacter sp. CGMCC 1.13660]MVQ30030.1 tetratricopeptide repeat protein [Ramlibacter pinisoli]